LAQALMLYIFKHIGKIGIIRDLKKLFHYYLLNYLFIYLGGVYI